MWCLYEGLLSENLRPVTPKNILPCITHLAQRTAITPAHATGVLDIFAEDDVKPLLRDDAFVRSIYELMDVKKKRATKSVLCKLFAAFC